MGWSRFSLQSLPRNSLVKFRRQHHVIPTIISLLNDQTPTASSSVYIEAKLTPMATNINTFFKFPSKGDTSIKIQKGKRKAMAFRMPRSLGAKKIPKGYFAVYVGENLKRFVIPLSFLNQSLFQNLLGLSEEEFGYSHPTGGLRIPCDEDIFLDVTSRLN